MLAGIISLLQDQVQPQPHKPMIKIDRGGGGSLWGPGYTIVDIGRALGSFREIPGEHPVARAARRTKHVGEHLRSDKEHRENREAAAFLYGATLADAAAEERHAAAIRELISIVDEVRAAKVAVAQAAALAPVAPVAPAGRGGGEIGAGAVFAVIGGVALVAILARRAMR